MELNEQLASAIHALYATFARYPRPQAIEYCHCGCTRAEAVLPLLSAPLHEIKFGDLEDYAFSAMTTQGSPRDYKYFLPRLLEGIVCEPYGMNPEILFGKLRYATWLAWDAEEVAVVHRYLSALWKLGLCTFPISQALPAFSEIETLIASIASAGDSLESYLNIWSTRPNEASDRHLIQFVTQYGSDFGRGETIRFGFWEQLPKQAQELRQWLLKPSTLSWLESSAHLLPNDGYEHLFGPALQVIRAEAAVS